MRRAFGGWLWACGWLGAMVATPVPLWLVVCVYLPALCVLSLRVR